MTQGTIHEVLRQVLLEFPVKELAFAMPKWVTMLSAGHWLQQEIYAAVREYAEGITSMRTSRPARPGLPQRKAKLRARAAHGHGLRRGGPAAG